VCGRRWGKTTVGLICATAGHGPANGHWPGAIHGAQICWVAPTYPVARDVIWPQLKEATREICTRKSEQEHKVELIGGGMIKLASADNEDTLRGPGWDGVIMDEAPFQRETVWTQALRPTLATTNGWSLKIGTPNGFNWFHKHYQRSKQDATYECWQRPTRENPLVTEAELAEALLDMGPHAFAQEFINIEGAEFSPEYFHDGIWFDTWPDESQTQLRVIALDPSLGEKDKSDFSAFVMLAVHNDGSLYVDADIDRRDVEQLARDAVRIGRQFKPHYFGVEGNGFQRLLRAPIEALSRRDGMLMPVTLLTNTKDKKTRIRTLTPRLSRGLIRFKRTSGGETLVEQLRGFPVAEYDDGPDALEMAISVARHAFSDRDDGGEERVDT
jgi:predicted phage terminase large subunit-like protein